MRTIITGIMCVVFAAFFLNLVSCKTIAVSGPKKYKVALNNITLKAKDEIETHGKVSDNTLAKLEKLLTGYADQFSDRGSYIRANEALISMKLSVEEPDGAFMHLQNALQSMYDCQELLKTEVKD